MQRLRFGTKTNPGARLLNFFSALGVVTTMLLACANSAAAESAYCSDLRSQIARADSDSASRYRAAASKQASELNRTAEYARRLGCDRQQFLFFGDPPPPQCGQINARIAQMRANLGALQQGAANGGPKQTLLARYDAQCRGANQSPQVQRGFLEDLFGAQQRPAPRMREMPLEGEDPYGGSMRPQEDQAGEEVFDDGHPTGGAEAVCVRGCDGGFFPISYSARRDNLDDLNTLCKALCPGAEASLYTKSLWKEIDQAVSLDGDSYANHPNAFKFQKSRDASCSCKPQGQTWAEALGEAERILAQTHSKDTVVTAEQAEQLSRPAAPATSRRQSNRQETRGSTTEPTPARPEAPASADQGQGVTREVTGPDGVKRRVRVVAPTL